MRMSRRMVLHGTRGGEILVTKPIRLNVVTETRRYTNISLAGYWGPAERYDMEPPYENYVGHKRNTEYGNILETNSMLVPIKGFSFDGDSMKLTITCNMFCVSSTFEKKGFNWAICTSDANKKLYQGQSAVANDEYQLASGWNTMPYVGGYQVNTLEFPITNIPSDTPLYLFMWPNGTHTGVSHFQGYLEVALYYET